MKQYLLPKDGTFYKANLHCHTTVSDGETTPAAIKAAYMEKGYSVVAFTDHEALIGHDDLSDDRFIALNGYETAIKSFPGKTVPLMKVHHLNFIKMRPHDTVQFCFYPENFTQGNAAAQIPFLSYVGKPCEYRYTPDFINYLIETAHENGCLVFYNHPRWSLQTAADIALFEGLDGLEIYNTGSVPDGDCDAHLYAELCRMGIVLPIVAGDDNHNWDGDMSDSFGGYTMIKASSFTYEGITDALARGDMYVSTGPEIRELYMEDGNIVIRTSPAACIQLFSEGRYIDSIHGQGGYIDSAVFAVNTAKMGKFFRLEVTDSQGNKAFTKSYLL